MSKRVLSVLLTLALLCGALGVAGWTVNAATLSDYATGATVTEITASPQAESLIKGKSSTAAADVFKNGKDTDGLFPGIDEFIEPVMDAEGHVKNVNDASPHWGIQNTTNDTISIFRTTKDDYTEVAYDIGANAEITSFAIGSTAEPAAMTKAAVEKDGMTKEQIIDWMKTHFQPYLRFHKGEFYVSSDGQSIFTAANKVATWDFTGEKKIAIADVMTPLAGLYTLSSPVEGRYVGFRLFDPSAAADGYCSNWSGQYRTGELAVYGEKKGASTDPVFVTGATVTELKAAPEKTSLIAGKNSIDVSPALGTLGQMTDGLYPGINQLVEPVYGADGKTVNQNDANPGWGIQNTTNDMLTILRSNSYLDVTYDLGIMADVDSFAIGSSAEPRSALKTDADKKTKEEMIDWFQKNMQTYIRLHKGAFFVGSNSATLYSDNNKVAEWDYLADKTVSTGDAKTPLAGLYTLKTAKNGRYVGFRIYDCSFDNTYGSSWHAQLRIGELAAFGTKTGEVVPDTSTNLIAGKDTIKEYLSVPEKPGEYLKGQDPMVVHVGDTYALTDGDISTVYNPSIIRSAYACQFHSLTYDPPAYIDGGMVSAPGLPCYVAVYYLGGTCRIDVMKIISDNQPGYYIAGADFYVSDKIADLFNAKNLAYSTNGLKKLNKGDHEEFDPQYDIKSSTLTSFFNKEVTGRYVAFVVTRPAPTNVRGYGILRFAEFQAMGEMLEPDEVFDTERRTLTDEATGIKVAISQIDNDDTAFFNDLALKVEKKAFPADMNRNIEDNWLSANSDIYTLTLTNKAGRVLTEGEIGSRYWEVKFPVKNGYNETLGQVKYGVLGRVRNAYVDAAGEYVIAGNAYAEQNLTAYHEGDAATIYGNGLQFVVMKFNDYDTINKLSGQPDESGIILYATGAAADSKSEPLSAWIIVIPAIAVLLGGGAILWIVRRRRAKQ